MLFFSFAPAKESACAVEESLPAFFQSSSTLTQPFISPKRQKLQTRIRVRGFYWYFLSYGTFRKTSGVCFRGLATSAVKLISPGEAVVEEE
jgi:hypothetical protein